MKKIDAIPKAGFRKAKIQKVPANHQKSFTQGDPQNQEVIVHKAKEPDNTQNTI